MRLHRLEVEGFGPFRERQSVDFDAFADDGIFLIAGRTGAGKSSILDAVCFALYGGVPRYNSSDKRLRSDHSDTDDLTEVVVEFSTQAGRFRVARSPEYMRPAKRGGGLTKQAPAVSLETLIEDEWVGLAARAVDVGNELSEILQLSQEQFLQVILLAQNRFADFLLADSKDRQKLLRRLFGTERFEDYQARFEERRRASELALGRISATVQARVEEGERVVRDLGLDSAQTPETAESVTVETMIDRIAALQSALLRAHDRSKYEQAESATAESQLAAADSALALTREKQQAQQERDRARTALAALDRQVEEIEALSAALERARTAETLRAPIEAAKKASSQRENAATAAEAAQLAWAAMNVTHQDEHESVAGLRAWADERNRLAGSWRGASELENSSAEREALLAAAEESARAAEEQHTLGEQQRAALPLRLATLVDQHAQARRAADRREDLVTAHELAKARRTATTEVERGRTSLNDAERKLADATAVHATAQRLLAELRQRRLDGYAGELASALVSGEACAVCGSADHPRPADHSDPVLPADTEAAETARDEAAGVEKKASDLVATLSAALAVAVERAGGRTAETAELEEVAAAGALRAAEEAEVRAASLEAERQTVQEQIESAESAQQTLATALSQAREAHGVAAQQAKDANALIAQARAEFATVADRIAVAVAEASAAATLASAREEHDALVTAARQAEVRRDALLAASTFADVQSVEAALLSSASYKEHEQRVVTHRAQREKERDVLARLEAQSIPEEAVDLASAQEAAATARTAWVAAVDQARRATTDFEHLASLTNIAATEHTANAEQEAAHSVLEGLSSALSGRGNRHKMNLETFVLAAELEDIVAAANLRLHDMSAGRYQLQHSDKVAARNAASGLGIVVYDAFTGHDRPAQSLSGGETFLSSLSLALGLAEVVTSRAGGIQLDTLFIDEGFGSLDADTLEVAMRTLDELRQGGRTVGVISHVEAMQEAIPAQLTVRATSRGPSIIE